MTQPSDDTSILPEPLATAPATGSLDPYFTELEEGEEPVVVGTLFLSIILLMIIAGIWVVVYMLLIGR